MQDTQAGGQGQGVSQVPQLLAGAASALTGTLPKPPCLDCCPFSTAYFPDLVQGGWGRGAGGGDEVIQG